MSKLTLCVSVLICLLLCFNVHAADNGLFMVVKGTVKVISGKDKSTATAKVGSKVFSGDTVITEKDSRAKIVMADRNVLQLSPDTKFEITNYKTSEVESERTAQLALMQGKVRAQVEQKYGEKNKFEMKTPTAVAGVRGTQYVVQFNPTTAMTSIMVMAGKVMVSPTGMPAAAVAVTPNQGVTVAANATQLKTFAVSKKQMNGFSDMGNTQSMDSMKDNPDGASNGSGKSETRMASENDAGMQTERGPAGQSETLTLGGGGPILPPPPIPPQPPKSPDISNKAKEILQNVNSKTKVIVTPKPQ